MCHASPFKSPMETFLSQDFIKKMVVEDKCKLECHLPWIQLESNHITTFKSRGMMIMSNRFSHP